jgi:hypothetical protein
MADDPDARRRARATAVRSGVHMAGIRSGVIGGARRLGDRSLSSRRIMLHASKDSPSLHGGDVRDRRPVSPWENDR